jgi:hypothetical protein
MKRQRRQKRERALNSIDTKIAEVMKSLDQVQAVRICATRRCCPCRS